MNLLILPKRAITRQQQVLSARRYAEMLPRIDADTLDRRALRNLSVTQATVLIHGNDHVRRVLSKNNYVLTLEDVSQSDSAK